MDAESVEALARELDRFHQLYHELLSNDPFEPIGKFNSFQHLTNIIEAKPEKRQHISLMREL